MRDNIWLLAVACILAIIAFFEAQWIFVDTVRSLPTPDTTPSTANMAIFLAVVVATPTALVLTTTCYGTFICKFTREWQGDLKGAEYFDLGKGDGTMLPSCGVICSFFTCGFFAHYFESEHVTLLLTFTAAPVLLQFVEFLGDKLRSNVPDG